MARQSAAVRRKRDAAIRRANAKAKGRKKRRPRRIDPLLEQAQNESLIAYGPQLRGLAQLMAESKADYRGELRGADVASQEIMRSVDRARPEMQAGFERAGRLTNQSFQAASQGLAGLSAAADPYKAAALTEQAGAEADAADLARRTDAELVGQRTNAAAGRVYQRSAARSRYTAQREKHRAAQLGLHEDVGRFTIKAYGDLQAAEAKNKQEAAKLRIDRARLQEQIRHGRSAEQIQLAGIEQRERASQRAETGKNRRAAAKGGASGRYTQSQLSAFREQWGKAVSITRANRPRPADGNDMVAVLAGKGISRSIARGAVQTYLFGGIRKSLRGPLARRGLKPKLMPKKRSRRPRPAAPSPYHRGIAPGLYR